MRNEFTAIVERDGPWYVAYCAEVPGANGQGHTREECLANLREAIAGSGAPAARVPARAASQCQAGTRRGWMKREGLLRHLRRHGCVLRRERARNTHFGKPSDWPC